MSRRICFLICFRDPETGAPKRYEHAGHYLGTTTADRLDEHVDEHRQGRAGVLTAAARAAGLDFKVTRTWPGGHRKERQLKTRSGALYCPDCSAHPQPGTTPPQPGAEYLTRRQREARALAHQAHAAPQRTPLWQLERTEVEVPPHECGAECECGQIEAAVSRFLQSAGIEPRKDGEMTETASPLTGPALDAAIEEAAAQFPDLDAGSPGDPAQLAETIRDWMADLPEEGRLFLREALADAIEGTTAGDYCAECETAAATGDCPDHLEEAERRRAYATRLSQLEAEDAGYQPDPLPRQLGPAEAADALAPLAAELPDGTPHSDPALAVRGWQAQGGLYVREPMAQMEAG